MKIIVGLGNPGEKYINNRHNVGFMFIDYIISSVDSSRLRQVQDCTCLRSNNNTLYSSSEMKWSREDIVLAKPQTFMNKSGLAVKTLTTHYKLPTTNLIVVHDDLDIPLGKFRIDLGRGPKLHNGITSIEQTIKTQDFWRVRIGVDNRQGIKIPGEDYVLQDFKEEEREAVNNLFPKIFEEFKIKLLSLRT